MVKCFYSGSLCKRRIKHIHCDTYIILQIQWVYSWTGIIILIPPMFDCIDGVYTVLVNTHHLIMSLIDWINDFHQGKGIDFGSIRFLWLIRSFHFELCDVDISWLVRRVLNKSPGSVVELLIRWNSLLRLLFHWLHLLGLLFFGGFLLDQLINLLLSLVNGLHCFVLN